MDPSSISDFQLDRLNETQKTELRQFLQLEQQRAQIQSSELQTMKALRIAMSTFRGLKVELLRRMRQETRTSLVGETIANHNSPRSRPLPDRHVLQEVRNGHHPTGRPRQDRGLVHEELR